MSDFEKAVEIVLSNEKGIEEDEADSGGTTNFGISLRFLRMIPVANLRRYGIFTTPDNLGADEIKQLTLDQAKLIYQVEFWEKGYFDQIENQHLCNYIFDMTVDIGPTQTAKIVQRAICAFTSIRDFIKEDGIMGYKTITAINFIDNGLCPILRALRAEFYRQLVVDIPKNEQFLDGWLNRCYKLSV